MAKLKQVSRSMTRTAYPKQIHVHVAIALGYQPDDALQTVRMADGRILTGRLVYQRRG